MSSPILSSFSSHSSVTLVGDATLNYGKFITAVVNFLIMALVIFCVLLMDAICVRISFALAMLYSCLPGTVRLEVLDRIVQRIGKGIIKNARITDAL